MRLIDGTIQALPMVNYILERKDTFIKVLQKGDNDFLFAMLMDYFDSQPTAYDVDEVVERLETYSNKDEAERLGTIPVVELEDAFKIVKGGGIDEW